VAALASAISFAAAISVLRGWPKEFRIRVPWLPTSAA
jgi:hypothetical protein